MIPLVYIAGPFRGPTAYDVHRHVCAAEQVGLEVARRGGYPVIPHTMTQHFHGQLTDDFWLDGTLRLLRCCEAIVLIDGWHRSAGATEERNYAQGKMPVFYWGEIDTPLTQFAAWTEAWTKNRLSAPGTSWR